MNQSFHCDLYKVGKPCLLRTRIAELEKRIQNAIDDVNATDKCMKFTNRIDMTKVLERIRYILTEPPREEG